MWLDVLWDEKETSKYIFRLSMESFWNWFNYCTHLNNSSTFGRQWCGGHRYFCFPSSLTGAFWALHTLWAPWRMQFQSMSLATLGKLLQQLQKYPNPISLGVAEVDKLCWDMLYQKITQPLTSQHGTGNAFHSEITYCSRKQKCVREFCSWIYREKNGI